MATKNFTELVTSGKAGIEDGIRGLVRHFQPDLHRWVRRHLPQSLRSQYDSMDFVQDIWKSFFIGDKINTKKFDDSNHMRAYLIGIGRNKINRKHRQNTEREEALLSHGIPPLRSCQKKNSGLAELPDLDPSPSKVIMAHDIYEELIKNLSPREVKIIELLIEHKTQKEICVNTGLSERTVRRWIAKFEQRMAKIEHMKLVAVPKATEPISKANTCKYTNEWSSMLGTLQGMTPEV